MRLVPVSRRTRGGKKWRDKLLRKKENLRQGPNLSHMRVTETAAQASSISSRQLFSRRQIHHSITWFKCLILGKRKSVSTHSKKIM